MGRATPPILDIAAFVSVAQNASFTRAAEQLETSKSNVGKAVQRLEARLATRLFQRTTRVVRLTEDGETYLEAARSALDGLAEAEVALAARRDEPVGRVRVDAPVGFGGLLIPTLGSFRKRYPQVTVELSLTDYQTAAVGEGWDIVVRIGELPPSGDMTVRKLCDLGLALYASPDYLERHGAPSSVQDLWRHEALIFRTGSGQLRPWTVHDSGHMTEVAPTAGLIVADGRSLIDAARCGLGIAQIFDRVAQPYVTAGELCHVMPEADAEGPPVHALIPLGRRMPPKTRVMLDHLSNALRSGLPAQPTTNP